MRDVNILQFWDLNETLERIARMDEGFDQTPKLRLIPKKIDGFEIQQLLLATIKGIGKVKSAQLLTKFGTIENIIKELKKTKEITDPVLRRLKNALIKKPKAIKK